jgi:hypothetical protein
MKRGRSLSQKNWEKIMITKLLFLAAWWILSSALVSAQTNSPVTVFMPDGQVRSHLLRVFITKDIEDINKVELTFIRPPGNPDIHLHPRELARFQQWPETKDGVTTFRNGTLLLFDWRGAKFSLKPCIQVTAQLTWGEPRQTAIAEGPVLLGNVVVAATWAFSAIGLLGVGLLLLARKVDGREHFPSGRASRLFLNPEGRLSLSKTQAAFWTFIIVSMVLCFGLMRREVPSIPEQLVALMGLSLATRAAIFVTEQKGKPAPTAAHAKIKPRLSDLLRSSVDSGNPVAITKAQMLMWTCVAGFLFCVKSLLNGALWELPWQLVTLMGISQISYVVPPAYEKIPKDGRTTHV